MMAIMKRKFINFSDKELNILEDAIKIYGSPDLLKQIKQEKKNREYARKQYEEWQKNKPKIYCS